MSDFDGTQLHRTGYLPTRPGTQLQWTVGPSRGARAWLRHQLRHRGGWGLGCGYCRMPVMTYIRPLDAEGTPTGPGGAG